MFFGCCVFTKCGLAYLFYSNLFIQNKKIKYKNNHKEVAATLKRVFVARFDPYGILNKVVGFRYNRKYLFFLHLDEDLK